MSDNDLIDAAKGLLSRHEGRRTRMYKCSAGYNTIGVGHNLDALPISEFAVDVILADDLKSVFADLDRVLPWWRREGWVRQLALLDLCFNLGIERLSLFKNTLSAWERGNYPAAAAGLVASKWFTQVGVRGPRVVQMVRDGTMPA